MISKKLFLLFFLFALKMHAQQYVWTQRASLPGPTRQAAVGFSLNSFGYVGTGYNNGICYNDFWKYNPNTDSWTQVSSLPASARYGASCCTIGGKAYVGIGWDDFDQPLADFFEYDPASNQWAAKANYIGNPVYTGVGFSNGSIGYFGTGYYPYNSSFYAYDPSTNLWTTKAPFPGNSRQSAIAFNVGGSSYLGLGSNGNDYNDLWKYDDMSDTWSQMANFPLAGRYGSGAFVINNKAFVIGGAVSSIPQQGFCSYDPLSNQWSVLSVFVYQVMHPVCFSIGSAGYLCSGLDNFGTTNYLWQYAPAVGVNEINTTEYQLTYNPRDKSIGISSNHQKSVNCDVTVYTIDGSKICNKVVKPGDRFIFSNAKGTYVYTVSSGKDVLRKGKFSIGG